MFAPFILGLANSFRTLLKKDLGAKEALNQNSTRLFPGDFFFGGGGGGGGRATKAVHH